MNSWIEVVLALLAVMGLLVVPLALLAARRRWLARQGGTFECSLRLGGTTSGAGWMLGMARYNLEVLEWFRFFSYSYGPRMRFLRGDLTVLDRREPASNEAHSLYAGQEVVRIQVRRASSAEQERLEQWELAMGPDSLTGLLSWLEAAPPGVGSYGLSSP
jgi:hypothetical protein